MNGVNNYSRLTVTIESFTFYSKSGYFYFTVKNKNPVIKNNQIVLDREELFQIKYKLTEAQSDENLSPSKLFYYSTVDFNVDPIFETCTVKGLKTKRFAATAVVQYENNFREAFQQ